MLSVKLLALLLIVMVSLTIADGDDFLTREEGIMLADRAGYEAYVFSTNGQVPPERMLVAVTQLNEVIYTHFPYTSMPGSHEEYMRVLVEVLYKASRISSSNCRQLMSHIKFIDGMCERYVERVNAVRFMKYYKKQQINMCVAGPIAQE